MKIMHKEKQQPLVQPSKNSNHSTTFVKSPPDFIIVDDSANHDSPNNPDLTLKDDTIIKQVSVTYVKSYNLNLVIVDQKLNSHFFSRI